jgi:hypothetical protein
VRGDAISVELDAMSGRSNPSWTLDATEAAALRSLVAGLVEGATEPAARLGYRGFLVRVARGGATGAWLRVAQGTVSVHDGRSVRVCADVTGVEAWLRQQADARGYGPLVDAPQEHTGRRSTS